MTDNNRGILWALIAAALFSVVAAMAKVAVKDYHVLQILFFRQLVVFVSSLPSIARSFPASLKTKAIGFHALRLVGAFIALSCGIWSVAVLPLATAITLAFSQVFFVALLAFWVLKEPVGVHRLLAVIVGFIGVLVVVRPGAGGIVAFDTSIPIAAALGAAFAVISVRKLSQSESTATLLVYQAVFVGVLAGVPLFWLWVTPDLAGFVFLLAMGGLATLAQWIGIKALRLGEASVIGNIEYTKLIYAAILGLLLFSEVPDIHTILGAALIVASSIYLFRRETTLRKAMQG